MSPSREADPVFQPDSFAEFHYDGVRLDRDGYTVSSSFSLVGPQRLTFTETLALPAPIRDEQLAAPAMKLLMLAQGLSYYKAAASPVVVVDGGLTDAEHAFLAALLRGGLGEFAYRNDLVAALTPRIDAERLAPTPAAPLVDPSAQPLVAVGGGKDSVVSIETLKAAGFAPLLFSVNRFAAIDRCVRTSGCGYVSAARKLDSLLLDINTHGAHNGHVPVTAVNSLAGLLTSHALGAGPVVMSNERSANYGNLTWQGHDINHQWSKTLAFENLLRGTLTDSYPAAPYFSLLRPLSELQIAGRFARHPQYFDQFTSCNKSFRLDERQRATHWCCDCPKCLFVFLILAPYLPPATLVGIFGENLLDEPRQADELSRILGYTGYKPFECVGDEVEARQALRSIAADPGWAEATLVRQFAPHLADYPDDEPTPEPGLSANLPPDYLAALHLDDDKL